MKVLSVIFGRICARQFLADDDSSPHSKVGRKKRSMNKERVSPADEDIVSTCIASSVPSGTTNHDQLSSFGSFGDDDDGKTKPDLVNTCTVHVEETVRRVHQSQKACKYKKQDTFQIARKGKGEYRPPSRHLKEGLHM